MTILNYDVSTLFDTYHATPILTFNNSLDYSTYFQDHVTSDSDMLLKLKVDPLRWNEGMKISMIVSLYNAVQVFRIFFDFQIY